MPNGITVYHVGIELLDGKIITSSGRVLGITAVTPTITEARKKVYSAIDGGIGFDGFHYRTDTSQQTRRNKIWNGMFVHHAVNL